MDHAINFCAARSRTIAQMKHRRGGTLWSILGFETAQMTGNWSQTFSEGRNVVDGPDLPVLTQGELADSYSCVSAATPEPLGHGGGGGSLRQGWASRAPWIVMHGPRNGMYGATHSLS